MPELPEVETVMRGLRARLEGRTLARARINRPDMRWAFPVGLAARLAGARVIGFRRRAKYILMRLDGGDSVLIHLGMSGRMVIAPVSNGPDTLHEHLTLETAPGEADPGWRVAFVDPRRFGSVDLVPTAQEDAHRLLAGLGPEPLGPDFTPAALAAALDGRRTSIKAALLDQRNVAGLGNIYVCEALFRAGVAPERPAHAVTVAEGKKLVRAIRAVLGEAIAAGGSSLRDYVRPEGELGYFQHAWKVYGREGEPCDAACPGPPACPGVQRVVQSARSSFYCRRRQR
jgi:formamidopyrimidine-DNA glycosylase